MMRVMRIAARFAGFGGFVVALDEQVAQWRDASGAVLGVIVVSVTFDPVAP